MGGRSYAVTTVACVWVRGEFPYSVDYVLRLRSMVSRWIDRPFRFVCLTDRPEQLPDRIEAVPIAKLPGFAPWTKLELFNPARKFEGRVLYLDLDVAIVSSLAPIVDDPAPFAITADPASFHKRRACDAFGRLIVRRFNSSVMTWDAGTQTDLFTDWKPYETQRLSGDQDWIGERRFERARALPRAWFPRLSELAGAPPPAEAKVVLIKRPKNHEAVELYPWLREAWQ